MKAATNSTVEKAITALEKLPVKDARVSLQDAAIRLAPTIKRLRDDGYSADELASRLGALGVNLSAYSLRRAASGGRRRSGSVNRGDHTAGQPSIADIPAASAAK